MPDWSDVQVLWARRPQSGPPPEQWAAHLHGSHTVATQMGELIASEPWETWKAHLEALVMGYEADKATVEETIWSAVGDEVDRCRLRGAKLQGLIEGLRLALKLPAELIRRDEALQSAATAGEKKT